VTLLGPKDLSTFDRNFAIDYTGKPDIQAEIIHFAKYPLSKPLNIDLLISFVLFD
jgi:hypothetical protein